MSHFSVLVITNSAVTEDSLSKIMAPWHEFECTGRDDEYVVEVDETEELRAEYETRTERRLRSPTGELFEPWDRQFFRDPTQEEEKEIGPFGGTGFSGKLSYTSEDWGDGRGYRAKIRFVPEGYEEVQVPTKELESFADWAAGWTGRPVLDEEGNQVGGDESRTKYGWITVDANGEVIKIIDRTNPNKKWDWYQVGGRYSGRLITKAGKVVDQGRIGDLDVDAMKAQKVSERSEAVEEIFRRTLIERDIWDSCLMLLKKAREKWGDLPEPRPRGSDFHVWIEQNYGEKVASLARADIWNSLDDVPDGVTIEEWIESTPWLSCWAMVRDGQWAEKGEMGWFGVSHGDKEDWPQIVAQTLGELTPDQHIAVVDCHI